MAIGWRIRVRFISVAISFVMAGGVHAALLLDDPLQGSTTGNRSGGSFVAGGWQVTNQYDDIYWHVPLVSKGSFEYDVRGLGNTCVGGAGFKNELSHMYDYTIDNADNQYAPGYRDDPYKQFIRKQCESGKERSLEIVWSVPSNGNFYEIDSAALNWDSNTTYHWKTEWDNAGGNATLKIYRDAQLIFNGSLTGSWNPGGMSVRIASSPRRADEGAHVGAIFSNVKVYDQATAIPAAPTITAPTNGETIKSTVAYVQWNGDSHTLYQVRANTQNNPDAGIVWDSQQVGSTRNFTWTGPLSNSTTYYVFARLGSTNGWGPWSANGRTFTINTAFNPGGIDYVKVKGNSYANNSGPFLGLGFTHMRAMQRCKYDRPRYESDCAFMASKGFVYQRDLTMVDWDTLEIAPLSMTNGAGHFVPAWPDYWQQFRDHIDIAYSYGLKTEITVFAGAQACMPNKADRFTHLNSILTNLVGREHKIVLIEVGNELWQNGVNDSDAREFGQYLADRTPIPIALSSPADTSDSGIVAYYGGSAADIVTVHFSRDNGSVEGGWLPVRDCYRTGLGNLPPVSSNEPIGAGSSVSTELDPIKLCMAGVFAWNANLISYVYHSRAGVYAWENCCPTGGQERPFSTSPGVDSYQNIFPLLPKDLSSWERNDGKVTASPFTSYCMGQANKWWTEVGGSTNGCIRNISAIKGGEFVTSPIGILSGGLELEARQPMSFQVYNPLTGAVAYNLNKTTGEHFTLAQGPQAYVIKGVFTNVIAPTTEVTIDLGSPDVPNGIAHPQVGDGTTAPVTIGGRTCRTNTPPSSSQFFYFDVADSYAFNANKPQLYISIDYYDSGTHGLVLGYDSMDGDFFKFGGSVILTNTNTWKTKTWFVNDAYFGNREFGIADFRIATTGPNVTYLDIVSVSTIQPGPPIIAEVSPDPRGVFPGLAYIQQLTLTQGSPAPTWSVTQGPAGLQVNSTGLVSGWTPSALGDYLLEVQATNSQGTDTESWIVRVLSHFDFDGDGDTDSSDFGHLQRCLSGDGIAYSVGCGDADVNGDGDVDTFDFNSFLPCMLGPGNVPGC